MKRGEWIVTSTTMAATTVSMNLEITDEKLTKKRWQMHEVLVVQLGLGKKVTLQQTAR